MSYFDRNEEMILPNEPILLTNDMKYLNNVEEYLKLKKEFLSKLTIGTVVTVDNVTITEVNPKELFLVIGFQHNLNGDIDHIVLFDKDGKTFITECDNLIRKRDLTVDDMFKSYKKDDSQEFCYSCIKYVTPKRSTKHRTKKCPTCKRELHDV